MAAERQVGMITRCARGGEVLDEREERIRAERRCPRLMARAAASERRVAYCAGVAPGWVVVDGYAE